MTIKEKAENAFELAQANSSLLKRIISALADVGKDSSTGAFTYEKMKRHITKVLAEKHKYYFYAINIKVAESFSKTMGAMQVIEIRRQIATYVCKQINEEPNMIAGLMYESNDGICVIALSPDENDQLISSIVDDVMQDSDEMLIGRTESCVDDNINSIISRLHLALKLADNHRDKSFCKIEPA